MRFSLRQALRDSHVSAVAIAVLLFWSFKWIIDGLWEPFSRLAKFLFTAVAILDIPFISPTLDAADRDMFINTCMYFSYAISSVAADVGSVALGLRRGARPKPEQISRTTRKEHPCLKD
jgi:hypothetical protein